jgi:hypothetical protein
MLRDWHTWLSLTTPLAARHLFEPNNRGSEKQHNREKEIS